MTKIGIIIASTRPGRIGESVGKWVLDQAEQHGGADYELVDLRDFDLPHLDEELPAAAGQYTKPHTHRWAEKVDSLDGFVFVVPEYNHGMPGVLKTALDFLYNEWNNKAAGFVGYGVDGAPRSISQLRAVMGFLKIADVRTPVGLSLYTDFVDMKELKPDARHETSVQTMFDEVLAWSEALATLRTPVAA
ncbi:NADPH-dependent FMN reductase [Flindersiella endophytica]